MAQSLISCPVCSSPSFSNTSTLCLALVNVASKWLRCTMCEEELRGLDKLTIHLLGHLIHSPGFKRVLSNDTSDARSVLSSQPLNLIKNQSEQAKQITTDPVSDVDPTALQSNIENERPSLKIDDEVMIFFNSDNTNKHSPGAKENVVRTLDNETGSVSGLPKFTINFEKTATQSESISHCENLGKTSNRNLVEESSLNHSLQYFLPFNHENQNMINPVKEHELQMELCHEKEKEVPNLLETGQTTGVCNKISCSLENTENKIGLKNSYLSPKGERVVGFRCDICSLVFPDENILSMHRQLIHVELGSTEPTSYKCHLCSKSFVMKGSLMVHMRVAHFGGAVVARLVEAKQLETNAVSPDSAQFVCSVCNKGFQKEQQLALHEKLHDGKQCDICFKTFTTKYFLRKHKRLHTGEMPYQCSQCNKSFTFQQSYHKHLLYHSDDKPYTCSDCGRSFKELSTLHNHQRIHTGEKPFSCETCGKCFRQRVSYLVHRRIHTGVMPYRCQDCGKTFRYKVSERTHKCFTSTANSGTDVSTPLLSEAKCDDPATFLADENNQSGSNNEQVKIPDNTELKQSLAEPEMYPEPADFFSLVMSPSDRLQNLSLASEVEADMSPSDRGRIDSEALKQLLYDVADYS